MAKNPLKYSAQQSEVVDNIHRDTRTTGKKFGQFLKSNSFGLVEIGLGVSTLIFPPLAVPSLIAFALARHYKNRAKFKLPLYLPRSIGKVIDPNLYKAGKDFDNDFADGLWYLGREAVTGKHIYLPDSVARQHFFYNASTGGGKTESLIGVLFNVFIHGSGFSFIDGKADLNLPAKIMSIAHRMMRVDDVFLFNFIQGNRDLWGKTESQMSNTFNPLANGSVSSLTELFKSLLDGDGDIWSKRADSFIAAYMRVMVYLRDSGELALSVKHLSDYMTLEKLGALVGREDIPMEIKNELYNFVCNIPGMDKASLQTVLKGQSPKGNATVYDQLGYVTMQIIPVINMLKGDYGYIFDVMYGEIVMKNIVANRRIMICLLPALEKSSSTLEQLGRIAVSAIKDMAAGGLGSTFEGNVDKNLGQRFTTSKSAYPVICDEAGYYFVKGAFAPLFAQARSVGLSMWLSAQDIPALRKMGEDVSKEVDSVIGNSNTKLYGRIEDMGSTYEEATKRIGKVNVTQAGSREKDTSGLSTKYYEQNVTIQEKERVHQLDFARLREGQVFIVHMDHLVRVNLFAIFLPNLTGVTMNALTTIPTPDNKAIKTKKDDPYEIGVNIRKIIRGNLKPKGFDTDKEMQDISFQFDEILDSGVNEDSVGHLVLSAYKDRLQKQLNSMFSTTSDSAEEQSTKTDIEDDLTTVGQVDDDALEGAFEDSTEAPVKPKSESYTVEKTAYNAVADGFENIFGTSLLEEDKFKKAISKINKHFCETDDEADKTTESAISNIKSSTLYPSSPRPIADKDMMRSLLKDTLSEMDD